MWRNTGSGFVNVTASLGASLPGVKSSGGAWGDYNNDGRLDIVLTGANASGTRVTQVWRNSAAASNTPPAAPAGLTAEVGANGLTLSWSPATDADTPSEGLTYNLRLGTNAGGSQILAPQAALDTGLRRLPGMGNVQLGTTALFPNLSWGVHYWSVQAVDTAFAGSVFAPERRFVFGARTLPATDVGLTSATLNGTVHPMGLPTTVWFEWGQPPTTAMSPRSC